MNEHFPTAETIDAIIELELAMFLATQNIGGQANCQKNPNAFKLMRKMAHSVRTAKTLTSYLHDLQVAVEVGRNFMIEKYARMDNLIPPVSINSLIPQIVAIESKWRQELAAKFPLSFSSTESTFFEKYLGSELETLSDATLESYYNEVAEAAEQGVSLMEKQHAFLCEQLGYASLEAREAKLQAGQAE